MVIVVPHVVLSRPDDLDGGARRLRERDGFFHVIHFQTAAETASYHDNVDGDGVSGQARDGHGPVLGILRVLGGNPDGAAIGAHVGGAVQRLHRRVSQKGHFVDGRQALAVDRGQVILGRFDQSLARFLATGLGQAAVIPVDRQRLATLHGGPGIIGDDCQAAVQFQDVLDAGDCQGRRRVEAFRPAADDGRAGDDGKKHAGQAHIHAIGGAAVHKLVFVNLAFGRADEAELVRLLEGNGRGPGCWQG